MTLGRRHDLIGIAAGDALPEEALLHLAGNDGRAVTVTIGGRVFEGVKLKVALDLRLVRTVAEVALLREDGPDFHVEAHLLLSLHRSAQADQGQGGQREDGGLLGHAAWRLSPEP